MNFHDILIAKIKTLQILLLLQYISYMKVSSCLLVIFFQKVLKDKEHELLEQFESPEKIKDVLNALSNIIGKSKEMGEI